MTYTKYPVYISADCEMCKQFADRIKHRKEVELRNVEDHVDESQSLTAVPAVKSPSGVFYGTQAVVEELDRLMSQSIDDEIPF